MKKGKTKIRAIHRRQRKDGTLPHKEGKSKKTARLFSIATFAGGCFWCVESAFEVAKKTIAPGIKKVMSGYSGGETKFPTYGSHKGHYESVQIEYDPKKTKYKELLKIFWQNIDPTDPMGQFADKGPAYQTAIFYHDAQQKKEAEASKKELEKSKKFDKKIVTKILKAKPFYKAEEYHQDYYKKNPLQYKAYKLLSGRQHFLKKVWGKN